MHTFCGGMVKQAGYSEQTGPFACTVFPRHFLSTGRTTKPFPAFVSTCLFYCQGAFVAISNTGGAFGGRFCVSSPAAWTLAAWGHTAQKRAARWIESGAGGGQSGGGRFWGGFPGGFARGFCFCLYGGNGGGFCGLFGFPLFAGGFLGGFTGFLIFYQGGGVACLYSIQAVNSPLFKRSHNSGSGDRIGVQVDCTAAGAVGIFCGAVNGNRGQGGNNAGGGGAIRFTACHVKEHSGGGAAVRGELAKIAAGGGKNGRGVRGLAVGNGGAIVRHGHNQGGGAIPVQVEKFTGGGGGKVFAFTVGGKDFAVNGLVFSNGGAGGGGIICSHGMYFLPICSMECCPGGKPGAVKIG